MLKSITWFSEAITNATNNKIFSTLAITNTHIKKNSNNAFGETTIRSEQTDRGTPSQSKGLQLDHWLCSQG